MSHDVLHSPQARLTHRHVLFIALGGAIGTGLFLGSGKTIATAGPAILFGYAICGLMIYLIARALGEMTWYSPEAGSFSRFAELYIGRWAGFMTGWAYWFIWILVGMIELTGIGMQMKVWFPALPQWVPAFIVAALLFGINLLNVRLYGEIEFGITLIKILTVIALIVVGGGMVIHGQFFSHDPTAPHIGNLWEHGGLLPHGLQGLLAALPIAAFSFAGIEVVGMTTAEAHEPRKVIARAVNGIVFRIFFFYIGALSVVMMLYAWDALGSNSSPFVTVFERAGLSTAATIINIVVIASLVSQANTGMFATSRMLRAMADQRHVHTALSRTNRHNVPVAGLVVTLIMLMCGVLLNYLVPERVFMLLANSVVTLLVWVWCIILITHICFRRAMVRQGNPTNGFRLPLTPWSNIAGLVFQGIIVYLIWRDPDSRPVLATAPLWFGAMIAAWFIMEARRQYDGHVFKGLYHMLINMKNVCTRQKT